VVVLYLHTLLRFQVMLSALLLLISVYTLLHIILWAIITRAVHVIRFSRWADHYVPPLITVQLAYSLLTINIFTQMIYNRIVTIAEDQLIYE